MVLIGLMYLSITSLGRSIDHSPKSGLISRVTETEELREVHSKISKKEAGRRINKEARDQDVDMGEEVISYIVNRQDIESKLGDKVKRDDGTAKSSSGNEPNKETLKGRNTETDDQQKPKLSEEISSKGEEEDHKEEDNGGEPEDGGGDETDPCDEEQKQRCKDAKGRCIVNKDKTGATCDCDNEIEIFDGDTCKDPCDADQKQRCEDAKGRCIVNKDKTGPTCECDNEIEIFDGDTCKDFCSDEEGGKDCENKKRECKIVKDVPKYECGKCITGFTEVGSMVECVDHCYEALNGDKYCVRERQKNCLPTSVDPFYECGKCFHQQHIEKDGKCIDPCDAEQKQRCEGAKGRCTVNKDKTGATCDCDNEIEIFDGNTCKDPCDVQSGDGYKECSKIGKICVHKPDLEKGYECKGCSANEIKLENECKDPCDEDWKRTCVVANATCGVNKEKTSATCHCNEENEFFDEQVCRDPCDVKSGKGYKECNETGKICIHKPDSENEYDCQRCDDNEAKIENECKDPCDENWKQRCIEAKGNCGVNRKKTDATCYCIDENEAYDGLSCKNFCSDKEGGKDCENKKRVCKTVKDVPKYECGSCIKGFTEVGSMVECVDHCHEALNGDKYCVRERQKQCLPTSVDPFYGCGECLHQQHIEKDGKCIDGCGQQMESISNSNLTWNEICINGQAECIPDADKTGVTCNCTNTNHFFNFASYQCTSPCDGNATGYQECSEKGRNCVELGGENYECGSCTDQGFIIMKNGTCKEPDPCDSNPCQNDGECQKIDRDNYKCTCKDPFYGKNCEKENLCKGSKHGCISSDKCEFDEEFETYTCLCEEDKYFDFADRECKEIGRCFNSTCSPEKYEECDPMTGGCICSDGFRKNSDEECEISSEKCAELCRTEHSKCKIVEYPNNVECFCEDSYYLDAESKCKAKACALLAEKFDPCDQECTIEGGNITCKCAEEFTESENKCELKDENKCKETNVENGVCVKKGDKEEFKCNKGYELRGSKCIDICELDDSSAKFCPHGCTRDKDQRKCNCTEGYLPAPDGITCIKRTSCSEDQVNECLEKERRCHFLNGTSYECRCPDHLQEIDGHCEDSCTVEQAKECALEKKECRYNSEPECSCPFSMVYNDTTGSCEFSENYTFLTLILKTENSDKLKAYAPTVKNNDRQNDIKVAMKTLCGSSLGEVQIVDFRYEKEGWVYTISMVFDDEAVDPRKRLLHKNYCRSIDESYCLLPPQLIVAKNSVKSESFTDNRCNEKVREHSCPAISNKCTSEKGGYSCKCQRGFKVVSSFFIGSSAKYVYETCSDIDECSTLQNLCPENSKCKNTIGSYECVCNKGFILSEDEKECKGICDASPCQNNGNCKVVGGTYECACPKEFIGRNCEIENKNLKKANTNMIIIGAVLGGVLFISFIVILVLARKIKKKSGDDEYDAQMGDYGKALGKNVGDRERAIRGDRFGKHTYDNPAMS